MGKKSKDIALTAEQCDRRAIQTFTRRTQSLHTSAASGRNSFVAPPTLTDHAAGTRFVAILVAALSLHAGTAAAAQTDEKAALARPDATSAVNTGPVSAEDIAFEADQLVYDQDADTVTASGNVIARRADQTLRADSIVWNRQSGQVTAKGNVRVVNLSGDIVYSDDIVVDDSFRDGIIRNLLLVSQRGDRLAANQGERKGALYVLEHAAYTPCKVVDDNNCPKKPGWQIRAERVIYDEGRQHVSYKGARLELLGLPIIPLPGLSHPMGEKGGSGLMVPDVGYDRRNGFNMALPYYLRIADNRELTVTPHIYANVLPMLEGNYRALLSRGAYQVSGFVTSSRREEAITTANNVGQTGLRAYIATSGKLQVDPLWSITGSLRYVTDRTFLNRYDISREDRLRSTVNVERIGERSYFSIAGWAFQSLRPGAVQGQSPIALPAIDYRLRLADPLLGGRVDIQANSLSILRTSGQDTQRAFASGTWSLSKLTNLGQEVTFTGYARGDVYHSSDNDLTSTVIYRGDPGWNARGIVALAADMRWPFIGEAFGGTQQITPRVQLVASPRIANLSMPNEDSRAIDLEDSNLFALNRFPGYDRFEDSTRVTYGADYRLDRPNLAIDATVGQSYRLNNRATVLPDGTGLSDRLSDVVGRVRVRYKDFLSFTHRFRLDKDNLSVRRNEIDATIGSRKTYAEVGYIRLNRNITSGVEDLRDLEEIRIAGRVAFAKFWSVFGSTSIDLTGPADDPLSTLSGFEPVRHRLGITYENDCVTIGLTWRRDYQTVGDARRGNSFQLRLAFKNLGL